MVFRRGYRGFGTGWIIGSILSGMSNGGRSGGGWSGGGGGFGGFGGGGFGGGGGGTGAPTLSGTIGQLGQLYDALQDADVQPTTQLVVAVDSARREVPATLARWDALRTRGVPSLNSRLRAAGLPEVPVRR